MYDLEGTPYICGIEKSHLPELALIGRFVLCGLARVVETSRAALDSPPGSLIRSPAVLVPDSCLNTNNYIRGGLVRPQGPVT
jgi:hypothetical protein